MVELGSELDAETEAKLDSEVDPETEAKLEAKVDCELSLLVLGVAELELSISELDDTPDKELEVSEPDSLDALDTLEGSDEETPDELAAEEAADGAEEV